MSEEATIIAKIGLDIEPPAKEPIFISLSNYMNKKYLDIRKYYKDSADEFKPTKKGITMTLPQLKDFIKSIDENMTDIENWFNR
ncbi:MAG: transcriptional coactivator p15/PC4 family protein [Spirochaetales bacterium]|nr:transcriptional coactivator p15/PC4 family protein [Spirochaetales bacterium]